MTVIHTPGTYASVHDTLPYTVSDAAKFADPVTYPNLKFIADIYVDSSLIARLKKAPNPDSGYGYFDIAPVLRNYILATFDPDSALDIVAQELAEGAFSRTVTVIFGEEYSFTAYYNLVSESPKVVYGHYNRTLAGADSALTAKADKIATNNSSMRGDAEFGTTFYFLPYFATTVTPFDVEIDTSTGGTHTETITPSTGNTMMSLNISPGALNTLVPGLITQADTYYDVTIGTETYRVNIICESLFDPVPIHFLNQYGGFETKIFPKANKTNLQIQRKNFGSANYRIDGSGNVNLASANNVYYENKYNYSVQFDEKFIANTDMLSDAEYEWLYDLIVSPLVYRQSGSYFYPYSITDTNYDIRKIAVDDLTNLVVTFEPGKTLNAQYR